MNPIPAALARLVAVAAELKAGGVSWDQVASRVGRHPATCRRWTSRYADEWRRLFRAAQIRLLAEAGSEGMLELRRLLRSEDEKVRRDAARDLIAHWERLRAAEDPPGTPADDKGRVLAFLEGLDHVEIRALA